MKHNQSFQIATRSSIILLCIFLSAACGYQFGNSRTADLRQVGTLAIPLFRNLSFENGAGEIFTEAARKVFAMRGGFTLKQEGKASFILKGRVLSSERRTEALNMVSGSPRSGISSGKFTVKLRLEDSTGMLIKECRIVDKADSMGGEYPTDIAHNRHTAMRALAVEMMQRAYNEIVEGF